MDRRRIAITLATILAALLPALCVQPSVAQTGAAKRKVIRDPVEYNAYVTALNTKDANDRGAAMEAFVRNYPESVVKLDALEHAMAAYQRAGNTRKMQSIAKTILAVDPNNLRALAVATYLERSGSAMDGNDTCPQARRGLQILGMWQKPEMMTEVEFRKLRADMAEIFYGASAFCALQVKDYNAAKELYSKALQMNPSNLQNVYQMGMADLEMNPLDVNGFWYVAKAISLAQAQGKTNGQESMEAYGKAKYRKYHGNEEGWEQLVSRATTQAAPPPISDLNIEKAVTPAELAVQAAEKGAPLSVADWEFILSYRDASPANKGAAAQLWQSIQAQQQNGRQKLKLPSIKVVSASRDRIYGAVTDDNQQANHADLVVTMEKSLTQLPPVGSMISILGVIQDYTLNPFMFVLTQGELPGASPPTHAQLSRVDIEKLLRGGVTPRRVAELVKQKGVDFTPDEATEGRLRQAGATDELLLTIAKAKQE